MITKKISISKGREETVGFNNSEAGGCGAGDAIMGDPFVAF